MLCDSGLTKVFWAEAVATACHVLNRLLVRPMTSKTCFELFYDKVHQVNYFKAFGSKCFIKNTYENLDKFDPRSDEGIFVGYSTHSKAYRIYNKRTSMIEESLHVSFNKVS